MHCVYDCVTCEIKDPKKMNKKNPFFLPGKKKPKHNIQQKKKKTHAALDGVEWWCCYFVAGKNPCTCTATSTNTTNYCRPSSGGWMPVWRRPRFTLDLVTTSQMNPRLPMIAEERTATSPSLQCAARAQMTLPDSRSISNSDAVKPLSISMFMRSIVNMVSNAVVS